MNRSVSAAITGFICAGVLFNVCLSHDSKTSADPGPRGKLPPGWEKLDLTPDQKNQIEMLQAGSKGSGRALEFTAFLKVLTDRQRAELLRMDEFNRGPVDPWPKMYLLFDYDFNDAKGDDVPKTVHGNMNFGVWALDANDSHTTQLVFGPRGHTNNVRLRIGTHESTFGKPGSGHWAVPPRVQRWKNEDKTLLLPAHFHKSATATWRVRNVLVKQSVRIMPGEPVEFEPGNFQRYFDTCEVVYDVENMGEPVEFGMRVLLDTLIGDNDGVPFAVPGCPHLVFARALSGTAVPDFVMALEKNNLYNPGTMVHLGLRLGGRLETAGKVLLTRWPGKGFTKVAQLNPMIESWDVPLENLRSPRRVPDSAVVMYWPTRTLKQGEPRKLGYTYGLGYTDSVGMKSISGMEQLAVSVGGNRIVEGEITIMALVNRAKKNETVTIELPAELTPSEGALTQPVPDPQVGPAGELRPIPVVWRAKATKAGSFVIRVSTGEGTTQVKRILIRHLSIY